MKGYIRPYFTMEQDHRMSLVLRIFCVGLIYFVAAKIGLTMAYVNPSATPIWPPTGIALASLLLLGNRVWPGVFIAAFLVNILTAGSTITSLGIAFGNTAEGLIGAYLIRRFANGVNALIQSWDITKFAFLGPVFSTMVSATIGVTVLATGGFARWADYGPIWTTWWLGDATGALLVAPLALLIGSARLHWVRDRPLEEGLLTFCILLTAYAVFNGLLPFDPRLPFYTCLPLLLLTAFRFGLLETATAALMISLIAIIGTMHRHGPFGHSPPNQALISVQLFSAFITFLALVIAAVVQEAQSRSEDRFRIMVNAVKEYAIFMLDPEGKVVTWNEAAERIKGYTAHEIIGRDFSCFYTPEDFRNGKPKRLLETAARVGKCEDEGWQVRKDGSRFMAQALLTAIRDEDGSLSGFANVTRDVTKQRQTEAKLREKESQLLQSHKMETIGRLAGGIAHDFNNLLTVILGSCRLIREDLATDSPSVKDISELESSARRAATLTQQLLAFSRKQVLSPAVINLNTVIKEMGDMLRRLIGEDIRFKVEPAVGLLNVKADKGQIEQVIMNLVVNARDAMPKGGDLLIETKDVVFTEELPSRHDAIPPGRYAILSVSDTGYGMDAATQARLFEPFFTTKQPGQGTGMGLSTVYGIVKQSGGYVWVYSEPSLGSTFKICLPVTDQPAVGTAVSLPKIISWRGTETILVVEDDAPVQRLLVRMLADSGYDVHSAVNGVDAMQFLERRHKRVDLILTDIVMPEMSGGTLASYIKCFNPAIRIIYMSGYNNTMIEKQRLNPDIPNILFLQKPISGPDLLQKVRETLDRPILSEGKR